MSRHSEVPRDQYKVLTLKPEFLKANLPNQEENAAKNEKDTHEVDDKRDSDEGEGKHSRSGPVAQWSKKGSGHAPKRPIQSVGPQSAKDNHCTKFLLQGECPHGNECRFTHDREAYQRSKPADLEGTCPVQEERGKCPFGIRCRFSGTHKEDAVEKAKPSTLGGIEEEPMKNLRKKTYSFPRAVPCIKEITERLQKWKEYCPSGKLRKDLADLTEEERKERGIYEDYARYYTETPMHKRERSAKKDLSHWKGKTYLAPLTTVGNLPFRRVCKSFGVDITVGEMALGYNIVNGEKMEWSLTKRHESEDIFGVQIEANNLEIAAKCAEAISRECGESVDFIDLNCGCPLDNVTGRGGGSALLDKPSRLYDIVSALNTVTDCPVTVKLRKAYDDKRLVAQSLIPGLIGSGASCIALHGRTRQQRYTKRADWDYIGETYSIVKSYGEGKIPFIGNGDVFTYLDAEEAFEKSDIVMVARGALIKPWIFTEIKEKRHWDISSKERFDMLCDFGRYGLSHWGSDSMGVETTRKFLLEQLSFSHRYVPVGLIEGIEKCRPYLMDIAPSCFGRDDLETLFLSRDPVDWVKITEMILGKVPESFVFVPKHRASG